jgi:glycosyltransferase involved in cell wall biosynthesis
MKQKRAGVYDRWLHTLGGGEQVAFAYAEALRDFGYKTELITHKSFDIEAATKKMNVDLTDITVRYIPNLEDYKLSQFTEGYDVFVCNSYLDYIANRSKYGILSLFFPSKINLSVYEYLKRAHFIPSLKNFFVYPSQFEGFRFDEYFQGRLHKWLGKNSTITFNKGIKTLTIQLYFEYLAFSCLDKITFNFNEKPIKAFNRKVDHRTNIVSYVFKLGGKSSQPTFTINLPESQYSEGISLIKMSIPHPRFWIYNIFKSFFPKWEMRLHGGPSVTRFSDIESYDKVLSISEFSRRWTQKYWSLNPDVLYPPVAINDFAPAKTKKNIIAHVGRFFVGGHSKKQLELVRVFKKLVENGNANWELHLIGGVAQGSLHQRYIQTIKQEAEGYPIFFHFDATFRELQEVLSLAKIYWHATGLDEDEDSKPISMEHFGITTVEAMASGCVPLVIKRGGQPEIVTPQSGFSWETREDLLRLTEQLIKHPAELKKMSIEAVERSKYFSKQNFKNRLKTFLPNSV